MVQNGGAPPALLLGVLASMGEASGKPDFSRIEHDLLRKADDFRALRARLLTPLGLDSEFDRLRAEAVRALAEGRLAEADRTLAQAEQRNLDGVSAADKMSKERLLIAARGRADRGATALLQLNPKAYRDAAERFAEAALIAESAEAERGRAYALMQADALARIGADFRDRSGFAASITHLRSMLAKLDNFEQTVAWAEAQMRLARSLTGLAYLEPETSALREAADIYRTTLEDLREKQAPRLWLTFHSRLGEVLARLGEREDDAVLLAEGVDAFRTALAGTTQADAPREWTRLQFEFGKALVSLGLRASGASALEAAVNCFKLVLDQRRRDSAPLDWAEVQDRIGFALASLSAHYREDVVLEEAIAAYDAALEERRRETVPALWAQSAGGRAEARLQLARRLSDRALAEQAAGELMGVIETLRGLDHAADAKRFEPRLVEAGALIQQLRKG
ncbi:hypothetical protein DWF00_00210 [Bosea caraganae]|uniref:Tetratricopeptide repeat protein n=1 Tax=Bosea caraganae TaxID=2763117 RepID=A0A370L8P1_9HYPH|nr:hypothetical protein [Bosea caraganae]RDJ26645.1 hypothetical protein DWE98_07225 [Bosea caraganae]RDJ30531.1 hypothetical protein DWF00_00210 [Bosea caraganae]